MVSYAMCAKMPWKWKKMHHQKYYSLLFFLYLHMLNIGGIFMSNTSS